MGLIILMFICLVCTLINLNFILKENNKTSVNVIKFITTVLPFMLVGIQIMVNRFIELFSGCL